MLRIINFFLGILVLNLIFCGNGFAGEMNLWKKTIKLPEDIFKGHKKGLKKCKEIGNTSCYVHYSGMKPSY